MVIGSCADGRVLDYDDELCQFSIGATLASLADVRDLDGAGQIVWGMPEQREWLYSLDDKAFNEEHGRAMVRHSAIEHAMPTYHEPPSPPKISIALKLVVIVIIVGLVVLIASCAVSLSAGASPASVVSLGNGNLTQVLVQAPIR